MEISLLEGEYSNFVRNDPLLSKVFAKVLP